MRKGEETGYLGESGDPPDPAGVQRVAEDPVSCPAPAQAEDKADRKVYAIFNVQKTFFPRLFFI
jgi:hypothetical protein